MIDEEQVRTITRKVLDEEHLIGLNKIFEKEHNIFRGSHDKLGLPEDLAVPEKVIQLIIKGGKFFNTITGITDDVVAEKSDDILTLETGNAILSIVGTSETDTIKFTINQAQIDHDELANFVEAKHLVLPNTIVNVLSNHTKAVHDALALAHTSLSAVTANQHHAQAHTLASHSTKPHSALTDVGVDQHHNQIHGSSHHSGGGDAIKLDNLAAPDDNTDLDFSTTKHGLVPKGTDAGDFLKDDGTWAAAGGGAGDVTAAAIMTDHSLIRGDGGAKGIQDSGIIIDDADNITGITTIDTGEVFNSGGDLKIQPDVQGDIVLFGDTDVGDAADGKAFIVHRKAAEGDVYLKTYIDQYKIVRLAPSSGASKSICIGGGTGGLLNASAISNILFGYNSGAALTNQNSNVFIGSYSGDSATVANCVFIGEQSGRKATGSKLVFIGLFAGSKTTTGSYNVFVGDYAGFENLGGASNTFIGSEAGRRNTSGHSNIFIGRGAGGQNTTGRDNVYMGGSGSNNVDGNYNMAIGLAAMNAATSADFNVIIGYHAAMNITNNRNVIIGAYAGHDGVATDNTVLIGHKAGSAANPGDANVMIGYYAGSAEAGSNKLYIANSGTATPLIYGEFDNEVIQLNISLLGLFKVTPVVQQAHIIDADGNLADITTKFNALLGYLEAYGLLATS